MSTVKAAGGGLEVEAVKTAVHGRRTVIYWRYRPAGTDRFLGSVSRRTADDMPARNDAEAVTWRALGYHPTLPPPRGNRELGRHPTRGAAVAAVRAYLAELANARRADGAQ